MNHREHRGHRDEAERSIAFRIDNVHAPITSLQQSSSLSSSFFVSVSSVLLTVTFFAGREELSMLEI
jgi:hypothetical protein